MALESKFYAIDLFSGCGGLSEGFKQAGFEVIAQVEMDRWACETLKTRCLYRHLKEIGKGYVYQKFLRGEVSRNDILGRFPDIDKLIAHVVIQAKFGEEKFDEILKKIDDSRKFHDAQRFNVVIGGPPCQPYSLAGRSRDPDRMTLDGRHLLYEYYLKILQSLQPDFFVFENVPGLITAKAKGEEMFSRMLYDFRNISPSYEIAPSFDEYLRNPRQYLLNSAMYGVPQKRRRVVFIGYRKFLLLKNSDVKDVFKRILKSKVPEYAGYTVSDAIGDLPALTPGKGSDGWFGEYQGEAITPYQRKMRRNSLGILNHRARTQMKSDLERYRFFIEHRLNGNKAATLSDLMRERPDLTPAHNHLDEFLDRFKVQWWSQPSSTITAHICKDGHYYIHPDISQCRSFTVREAARCQSFPDNFKFEGPRTEQFKQVGNAVPPLLANVIAKNILRELKSIYDE
jgi:DNA (cytosine-5)-methyltransferase 1